MFSDIVLLFVGDIMRYEILKFENIRKLRLDNGYTQKQIAEMRLAKSYNEVKDKFTQQEHQIRDSSGRRWVQCELCGEIKLESEFGSYGGINHVNLGVCYKCSRRDK